jgi:rare lipoprotein A
MLMPRTSEILVGASKMLLWALLALLASPATAAVQEGVASWYGPGFHGRRAASGERFDQTAMTAAHRRLPFGTEVKVTNLTNGKSTVVRINDRGPYVKGRILDLSRAAAAELGMEHRGIARVSLEILPEPPERDC